MPAQNSLTETNPSPDASNQSIISLEPGVEAAVLYERVDTSWRGLRDCAARRPCARRAQMRLQWWPRLTGAVRGRAPNAAFSSAREIASSEFESITSKSCRTRSAIASGGTLGAALGGASLFLAFAVFPNNDVGSLHSGSVSADQSDEQNGAKGEGGVGVGGVPRLLVVSSSSPLRSGCSDGFDAQQPIASTWRWRQEVLDRSGGSKRLLVSARPSYGDAIVADGRAPGGKFGAKNFTTRIFFLSLAFDV